MPSPCATQRRTCSKTPSSSFSDYTRSIRRRLAQVPDSIGHARSVSGTLGQAISTLEARYPLTRPILEVLAFLNPDGVDANLFEQSSVFASELETADSEARRATLSALVRYSLLSIAEGQWNDTKILTHRLVQSVIREEAGDRASVLEDTAANAALGSFRTSNRQSMQQTYFGGRDLELDRIFDALWLADAPVVVVGSGGIGKSSIALQYASRSRYKYHAFWWVPCEDRHDTLTALAQLGSRLFGGHVPPDLEEAARRTINSLTAWQSNRKVLLLYDNVADVTTVESLMPGKGAAHVVLTSRSPSWPKPYSVVTVGGLAEREAADMIRSFGLNAPQSELARLVGSMGGHALALRMAGSFLAVNSSISPAAYLADFSKSDATPKPAPVDQTIEISIARLESANTDAADLLRLLALFHPDRIPLELISIGFAYFCGVDEQSHIQARLNVAIGDLVSYSLVRTDLRMEPDASRLLHQLAFVHRLVQANVIKHATPEHFEACVNALASVFPDQAADPKNWDIAEILVPHVRRAVGLAPAESWTLAQLDTITRMGAYFATRAMNTEAEHYMRHGLSLMELHPQAAAARSVAQNNLAGLLQSTNRYDEARALLDELASTASIVPQSSELLMLENRAAAELAQGRIAEAETLLQDLISRTHKDSREWSARRRRLADLYVRSNRAVEGERILREVTTNLDRAGNSPELSDSLSSLAAAILIQGRPDEAIAWAEQALGIDLEMFGRGHPRIVGRRILVAEILNSQGSIEAARDQALQAVQIAEPQGESPELSAALLALAVAHEACGDADEASTAISHALSIGEKVFGVDHPSLGEILGRSARLHAAVGEFGRAIEVQSRAVAIFERTQLTRELIVAQTSLASYQNRSVSDERPLQSTLTGVETHRATYGRSDARTGGGAIFLSHASRNDAQAMTLKDWLLSHGFDDLFVDHSAIRSGDKWAEALRRAKANCRVVLCLVTPEWLASDECYGEFRAAWYMGRRIMPLVNVAHAALDEKQRGRLAQVLAEDAGLNLATVTAGDHINIDADHRLSDRLKFDLRAAGALSKVGVDPTAFDIDRDTRPSPFPGLASFDDTDADAAIFFGRSPEIAQCIEDLRSMRATGDSRPYLIIGAAGCGKSSLMKAGILPRLRRERGWMVLRSFRPGADPLLNFAEALVRSGIDQSPGKLRDSISQAWHAGTQVLSDEITRVMSLLKEKAGRHSATTLIAIDQAEELVPHWSETTDCMVAVLEHLMKPQTDSEASPYILLLTVGSNALAEMQASRWLGGSETRIVDIKSLPIYRYNSSIEMPAARYGVEVDPDLVEAVMEDAGGKDALPLLALMMELLWRMNSAVGRLQRSHFEQVGKLAGLLEDAAERALRGMGPNTALTPVLGAISANRESIAADLFTTRLAGLNEHGSVVRRSAPVSQLSPEERDILEPFEHWRLVNRSAATVDVASEVLFRGWPRFQKWLNRARERLELLSVVERAAASWTISGNSLDLAHRGRRLKSVRVLQQLPEYQSRVAADVTI